MDENIDENSIVDDIIADDVGNYDDRLEDRDNVFQNVEETSSEDGKKKNILYKNH